MNDIIATSFKPSEDLNSTGTIGSAAAVAAAPDSNSAVCRTDPAAQSANAIPIRGHMLGRRARLANRALCFGARRRISSRAFASFRPRGCAARLAGLMLAAAGISACETRAQTTTNAGAGSTTNSTTAGGATNAASAPSIPPGYLPTNTLVGTLLTGVGLLDTNSQFFATQQFNIREMNESTPQSFDSVTEFTIYPGASRNFGAGAELTLGGLNAVNAAKADVEYGINYCNLRPYLTAGAGWSLVAKSPEFQAGAGLDVGLTEGGNLGLTTQILYQKDLHNDRNPLNFLSVRAGLLWKF